MESEGCIAWFDDGSGSTVELEVAKGVVSGIKLDPPENVTAVTHSKSCGPPISTNLGIIESEFGKGIQVDHLLAVSCDTNVLSI
jgi:hypothetical protein